MPYFLEEFFHSLHPFTAVLRVRHATNRDNVDYSPTRHMLTIVRVVPISTCSSSVIVFSSGFFFFFRKLILRIPFNDDLQICFEHGYPLKRKRFAFAQSLKDERMNGSKKRSSNLEDKPKEGKEICGFLQCRQWKSDRKGDNLRLNACNEGRLFQSYIRSLFCSRHPLRTTTMKVLTASLAALSVSRLDHSST